MMKRTVEEKVKYHIVKFGKKNKLCSILIMPPLFICMLFFHVLRYLRNNGKRMGMLLMTFILFVVFSSFSFPLFLQGSAADVFDYEYLEEAGVAEVELAVEEAVDLEFIKVLDDADVLLDEDPANGFIGVSADIDKYDAEDILKSMENQFASEVPLKGKIDVEAGDAADFSRDDWKLILINKQNSVPEDYELTLGNINTMKGVLQCDERIIEELLAMLQAAKEDDVILQICSPYRDMEYQQRLFNRKINRYMNQGMSYLEAFQFSSQAVTVPGASEHQIGLALDIVSNKYVSLNEGFGDTDAGKWLAANSRDYGFILRYPKGKEYITGIEYEPWHFRYVGKDAAKIIMDEGITLEEFWEDYL